MNKAISEGNKYNEEQKTIIFFKRTWFHEGWAVNFGWLGKISLQRQNLS